MAFLTLIVVLSSLGLLVYHHDIASSESSDTQAALAKKADRAIYFY
jgi:hypothetical protein